MARKLGEILIDRGLLTSAKLEEALRSQRVLDGSLGTHLLQLGYIDERELAEALAEMHGVRVASSSELRSAPPEVVALLSRDFAQRHRALPFRVDGDDLHLALQNPADTLAVHEAAFLTGFNVVPYVAPEVVLVDALERHHPASILRRAVTAEAEAREAPTAPVEPDAPSPPAPAPREPQPGPAVQALGTALLGAASRDEVFSAALDALSLWCERSLVFAVRSESLLLLDGRGLPPTADRKSTLPLGRSRLFTGAFGGDVPTPSIATGASSESDRALFRGLGGEVSGRSLVVPVSLRSRPVAVLFGDRLRPEAAPPSIDELGRVASITAMALESVLLRLKILKASGHQAEPAR